MGLRNTILEDGLQMLLDQCPYIVLDSRSIKLIIESGDFNQVISEYNASPQLEDVGIDVTTSEGKLDKIKKITKRKPRKKKQAED
tara:strand:- start:3728 stop:3982 length:255 start_codon:yes stop_codon:yes gene_type:complete